MNTNNNSRDAKDTGRNIISYFLVPVIAATVLTIIIGALIYYFSILKPNQLRDQKLLQESLDKQAELILANLNTWERTLSLIAENPALKQALTERNQEVLGAFEARISAQFPQITGVRILQEDVFKVNPASLPPVTHVTLDLIRTLKSGKQISPEIIQTENNGKYLAIILPISEQDAIVGFMLAGFDPGVVVQELSRGSSSKDYYEVWQTFGDSNQVIASSGSATVKINEPLAVSQMLGANWKLAFWPADAEAYSSSRQNLVYWVGFAFLLLTLLGLAGILFSIVSKVIKSDASHLVRSFTSGKGRLKIANSIFQLKLFQEIASALSRHSIKMADQDIAQMGSHVSHTGTQRPDSSMAIDEDDSIIAALGDHSDDPLEVEVTDDYENDTISSSIFRAYDIRGIVNENFGEEVVYQLGQAIGSEAYARGEQKVIVARDGRLSGPNLLESLKNGLKDSGRDVIDIGEVPTPLLYFASHYLSSRSGVMLTGSHNPPNYNGMKIVLSGETLSGQDIQGLYQRIKETDFLSGKGSEESSSVVTDYISRITGDVVLAKPLKVAIDCGNGVSGNVAPQLLQAMGCEVIGLYTEVDGNFPNHHPDPSKPENLEELIELVKAEGADIGLAFDGDGDRLGVIDNEGKIIWADRQMMLYAADVLSRNPGGQIIYDVKCSRHLAEVISEQGGVPLMWKTGHSLIKGKMRETGAVLAGECSGHIFFKERWFGFDDALYTAARLLEILANRDESAADIFRAFPESMTTPEINVAIDDDKKFRFIKQLSAFGQFGDGSINTIDGLRVDYENGWGLVRASNTTPNLVIRFEAETLPGLEKIKAVFKEQILKTDSSLELPF